jgi:PadR family transcriptional regulator PadR
MHMKKPPDDHVDGIVHELRRGVLVLAILGRLGKEQYGYSLREDLRASGLDVPEGTLYPLLRRLESQGLLESRWQMGEGRPRRYYQRSALGGTTLEKLSREWTGLVDVMATLMETP